MIQTKYVAGIIAILLLLSGLPTLAQDTAASPQGCEGAFDDVRNFTADVFEKSTAEIVDGVIVWDSSDWDNIVRRMVGTSEYYLNNCTDSKKPLAEQPEAVAHFAGMSLLQSPVPSVALSEDSNDVLLVSDYEPQTEWLDLNGDGVDELLLHTQVPYFSGQTAYIIRGGLSIAFFDSEDGWQGQVIAPVTSFVTTEGGDHVSYAMTEDNTLSVEEAYQALRYFPGTEVEVFYVDGGKTPLTAITLHSLTGAGEAKELNILSWDGRIPSVELRIAFDDWCYPGSTLDWEIREDGSVYVPSNGNEEGSPLHCGRTPEALFAWDDGQYVAQDM